MHKSIKAVSMQYPVILLLVDRVSSLTSRVYRSPKDTNYMRTEYNITLTKLINCVGIQSNPNSTLTTITCCFMSGSILR